MINFVKLHRELLRAHLLVRPALSIDTLEIFYISLIPFCIALRKLIRCNSYWMISKKLLINNKVKITT